MLFSSDDDEEEEDDEDDEEDEDEEDEPTLTDDQHAECDMQFSCSRCCNDVMHWDCELCVECGTEVVCPGCIDGAHCDENGRFVCDACYSPTGEEVAVIEAIRAAVASPRSPPTGPSVISPAATPRRSAFTKVPPPPPSPSTSPKRLHDEVEGDATGNDESPLKRAKY